MRFAGPICLALAVVFAAPVAGTAQSTSPGRGTQLRQPPVAQASYYDAADEAENESSAYQRPAFDPPADVEGTWVDDDGAAPSLARQPQGSPVSLTGYDMYFSGGSAVGQPRPMPAGGVTSQGAYPPGGAAMPAGFAGNGYVEEPDGYIGNTDAWGNIWADVHAGHRLYVRPEYMSMYTKKSFVPPLVTTSPLGTPQDQAGVLDNLDTTILYGNRSVADGEQSGGKITFGYWLVDGEFVGLEGHYFGTREAGSSFFASSTFSDGTQAGDIILARPFFNVELGVQDSQVLAFPDFQLGNQVVQLDGTVDVRRAQDTQSAGVLLRQLMWIDFTENWRVDVLSGYRFFKLTDGLVINDSVVTSGGLLAPTRFQTHDLFDMENEFHGGEIGLVGQFHSGRWSLEILTKVALGAVFEKANIQGSNTTTVIATGQSVTGTGGLLALPTNIGKHENDEFAVLPEGGLTVRYDVTRNLRATFGYTFIYLDKVLRAGEQVDLSINPSQIGGTLVGEARPRFVPNDSSFWVQGVTAGFEYRY